MRKSSPERTMETSQTAATAESMTDINNRPLKKIERDHSNIRLSIHMIKRDIDNLKQSLRTPQGNDSSPNNHSNQTPLYENEIEKCLTHFFFELNQTFAKDHENKLGFHENLENFIRKKSKKEKNQENLILQVIQKSKSLDAFSSSLSNTEKLKLFISILKNLINSQNKEYLLQKQLLEKISNETNYLQNNDVSSLENLHKWCQIDDFLGFSDLLVEIKSATQLIFTDNPTGFFCVVKVDGTPIGTTTTSSTIKNPIWDTALHLEITAEETVIRFVFEVFSNTTPPTQIGICSVTLDEIFENTLFRDKLEISLPLLSILDLSKMIPPTEVFVQEIYENQDEMEKYLNTKIAQQRHKGFLSLNLEIRLDPSFTDKIGKLRINRLQTLEVFSTEISQKIKRKYEYLKNSLNFIEGMEVDAERGILTKQDDMNFGSKKRDCLACGIGDGGCNIF